MSGILTGARTTLVVAIMLAGWASTALAATIPLACPPGNLGTVSVEGLFAPGDVVLLSGACVVNLVIPGSTDNLTIDGQGTATITAADPALPAVFIRGTTITLRGLTISGGQGVVVDRGGTATIDRNVIQSSATGTPGLLVLRSSYATIINNTIRGNSDAGILVEEGASARIGFNNPGDTTSSPNTVQNNGAGGISVTRHAEARIAGNTIQNNTGDGVFVDRVSQADIGSNDINGNTGNGINVGRNSGVNLGADTGTRLVDQPNTTSTPNGLFGIACFAGGYADGLLGTLNGTSGAKSFAGNCIDSLQ